MLFFCWKEVLTFVCPCRLMKHLWGLPRINTDLKGKKREILLAYKRPGIHSLWIYLMGLRLTADPIALTVFRLQGRKSAGEWNSRASQPPDLNLGLFYQHKKGKACLLRNLTKGVIAHYEIWLLFTEVLISNIVFSVIGLNSIMQLTCLFKILFNIVIIVP